MISRAVFPLIAALVVILPALAQHGLPNHTSYKGLETRAIKALSEQQGR